MRLEILRVQAPTNVYLNLYPCLAAHHVDNFLEAIPTGSEGYSLKYGAFCAIFCTVVFSKKILRHANFWTYIIKLHLVYIIWQSFAAIG